MGGLSCKLVSLMHNILWHLFASENALLLAKAKEILTECTYIWIWSSYLSVTKRISLFNREDIAWIFKKCSKC